MKVCFSLLVGLSLACCPAFAQGKDKDKDKPKDPPPAKEAPAPAPTVIYVVQQDSGHGGCCLLNLFCCGKKRQVAVPVCTTGTCPAPVVVPPPTQVIYVTQGHQKRCCFSFCGFCK